LKRLAEEHKSDIDEEMLKKLAERGVESTKFHGLDSVVFDKFGFSGMEFVDLNILLDSVRAKRNSAFTLGELELLRQELNDLRKLHQDLIDKSNQTIAALTTDRDETKKRSLKETKNR
jgi:hypothetical protein